MAVLGRAPMMDPIIRIDTNQGIYGLGEVRDGASKNYALMLKARLLGENPCNTDRLFRKIKQFGHHGRQGGGVCGVQVMIEHPVHGRAALRLTVLVACPFGGVDAQHVV